MCRIEYYAWTWHFHDTPISGSGACQHCNYHSQSTVEQAQESDEANLVSYLREVLLKLYVLQVAVFRVWLNYAVQIPVPLILHHRPRTMFLYCSVQHNSVSVVFNNDAKKSEWFISFHRPTLWIRQPLSWSEEHGSQPRSQQLSQHSHFRFQTSFPPLIPSLDPV